jgi:predicted alpha/beta-fold hydrolase
VQSILPSILPGWHLRARSAPLRAASCELLLDCGEGVRLQAFHSTPSRAAGPVAVLLHGWEGSADSHYILSLGQALFDAGVEVVRLNLRDHGATHHLNREIFHSCRLEEVCGAVAAIQQRFAGRPCWLIGFSLGGNFMLRVAASGDARVQPLTGVIAISPVLDPARTLTALEQGLPVYHNYFVRKWSRSLRRKQAAWPAELDCSTLLHLANLRRMTDALVSSHTPFPDMQAYLAGYAITGERLLSLSAPAVIVIARDDPIIPATDLARLAPNPLLRIVQLEHGGHIGFMTSPWSPPWIDGFVRQQMGLFRPDATGAFPRTARWARRW